MEIPTDSSVMQLVQSGESAQLAVLFERHHLPLFRYLFHLSSNRALSEDLVQETFFRILRYAKSYDPAHSFQGWLFRTARNAWLDSVRKGRIEVPAQEAEEIRSPDPMPEELFTRKQDVKFLEQAFRSLPEDKREVLVLSRFHGLHYDEIARILNCEVGAVKVRAFRALKQLRVSFCELRGEKAI